MKIDGRGEAITLAALCVVAVVLFGLPLGLLVNVGVGNGPNLLVEALRDGSVQRAAWNSLESASLSALAATLAGTCLALTIGLTDVRGKGVVVFLLLLPMMIPPQVTAIAWVQALGPSSAVLKTLGVAPPPGSPHPLYTPFGVMLLLTVQHTPLVCLVVLAALRTLPREMMEAARLSGAGVFRVLRRVILPLISGSLVAGFMLAFVSAMGNFGILAILGIPARYTTLPVLIWRRLSSFGPSVLTDVAVISIILGVVALVAITLQRWLQRRMRAAVVGPPQLPLRIALGPMRPLAEGLLALYIAATLFLPLAALVATALVTTYGLPLNAQTFTLSNFAEVLFRQASTVRAFVNSTLTAGVAALFLAALSIAIAYFMSRRDGTHRRIGESLSALADVSYAIPGLVISIAFILAFIRPLPVLNISLYNTLWIILLAYVTAYMSIALKPVAAAYGQLDPALDDAARVSGAGFGLRMRRVFTPLMAPAAASGAILVFLTAYNEVTVSALLWSTGNETIGTSIFNFEDGGYTTLAAAMSCVTVVATVVIMAALDRIGRRLPPGVVPWRI
ncbi:iron ABC transporter permease (plasmid) [Qingshengfaniella alkalisoli]|uniref:Iron ABC transporter permease n=1 Tax=Qingshengfaniella alkalisoli TaxID=2599296 RepID=A0A5B8IYR0_9RHOB|nr:iron ABC transporter permease [Qingshengfaniella alkalisoli]